MMIINLIVPVPPASFLLGDLRMRRDGGFYRGIDENF